MFINKNKDGSLNLSGRQIALLRRQLSPKVSQRAFADQLTAQGLRLNKNAVQRIESGQRFVTDIELLAIAKALDVPPDRLLKEK